MPSTSLWVQSHTSVWGDQETRDLRRSLGLEPLGVHGKAATVGYLHALWHYAADHQKDGDFSRYSDSDLAEAVNWPGDPHQFKDALLGSGHLTPECKIKDWDFYFISHWKARESNRARQSEFRGRHNARETDVTVTSALSNAHANGDVTVSVTRLPVPIPGPDIEPVPETPPTPSLRPVPPTPIRQKRATPAKVVAEPKPNLLKEAIDAIRAAGMDVTGSGRDGKALKDAVPAIPPAELADAYVHYRDWAPFWIVEGGPSIHAIVDNFGGYQSWVARGKAPRVTPSRNGYQPARGAPSRLQPVGAPPRYPSGQRFDSDDGE